MASTMRFDTWENPTGTRSLNIASATPGLTPIRPTTVDIASGSSSTSTVGTVSFSAVSSISLNGVFSSTYKNYRIIVSGTANTAGSTVYVRLRSSGTDRTNALIYFGGIFTRENGSYAAWGGSGSSVFDLGRWNNDTIESNCISLDLFNPFDSGKYTAFNSQSWNNDATSGFSLPLSGQYHVANSNDGFSLFSSNGLLTGSVTVYGYNA